MAEGRGHLKVFIGMAPGVGKTYRMLQEGGAEAQSGRDTVIGYLETHGRAETQNQADGLELVPRRSVAYRGKELEEMDLPAVLARAPELCLIDELAHTNAPGLEHEKRYEDVREVLDAGIDVYSTVNVQHLESLINQVERLTGTTVRETIPDEILSAADEVVLVDLTPEALIARLRAGKVYRSERVPAALNHFFKVENLAALRETALRQVAEDVEVKRLVRETGPSARRDEEGEPPPPDAGPQAISERLLALVTLDPDSEHVVRRAWRSAQRLDGDLDVLVV
jgi:two-component system sensor histidine kinase KdpD